MDAEIKVEGMTELDALRWAHGRHCTVDFDRRGSVTIFISRPGSSIYITSKSFLDAVIGARKALLERGLPDGPA